MTSPASLPDEAGAPGGCYLRLEAGTRQIVAGNALIERRWGLDAAGRLISLSLLDRRSGFEWLQVKRAPRGMGAGFELAEGPIEGAAGLRATVTGRGPEGHATYALRLDDGVAAATLRLLSASLGAEAPDLQEDLALAPLHLRLTQVSFQDRTDHRNELVHETEWLLHPSEAQLELAGCLFAFEDVLTGAGVVLLKLAPLPAVRPVAQAADCLVRAGARRVVLAGHGLAPGEEGPGYGWVTLLHQGGAAGRTAALHAYQRAIRPYVAGRDGQLLSNTWGDRNRDGRINAAFLAQEIEAGQALGIEVVQIDDGWQRGVSSNSVAASADVGVWEGFYGADRDFWAVHPERFPEDLGPLTGQARAAGMRLGLWFAPDSAEDFVHWQRDADRLLRLHAELGIAHVKIDGVKLRSRLGEGRLHAFFDRVLQASEGRIVFDSDVTAEDRPGYWGRLDSGPLFVENRYTDSRRYWPHATLRNLWQLARHVDPLRLRMEWLNNARNPERYTGDPLAPAAYRADYLFATVMFASPLAWFESSGLSEGFVAAAAPLIATWKAHRDAIFGGSILPIGAVPDGTSWTGFASRGAGSSYVLLFRELNDRPEATIPLPGVGAMRAEILGGEGSVTATDGMLAARIPLPQRFLFARLSAG